MEIKLRDLLKFLQYGDQPAAVDIDYMYGNKKRSFRDHYESLNVLLGHIKEDLSTKAIDPDNVEIDFIEVCYSLLDSHRYIKIYGHEKEKDESE